MQFAKSSCFESFGYITMKGLMPDKQDKINQMDSSGSYYW